MRRRFVYFSKQVHTTLNQVPRKTHFEDNTWIKDNQRKQPNGRRSAPLTQHQQQLQMNRQPMYNYPDHPSKNGQYRTFVLLEFF